MELNEARRRARDILARIRAGGNPAEDIRREKQTPTFREFTEELSMAAENCSLLAIENQNFLV